jgi:histidine triad (HIT) family protein
MPRNAIGFPKVNDINHTQFDDSCPFCRIVLRIDHAQIVCETQTALAFFPLEPVALGHTLVIPKTHVTDLWTMDDSLAGGIMDAVLRVGRAIRVSMSPHGLNLISSAGEAASQTVFHLHLHVVPRWTGDHIGEIWPPSQPWPEPAKDDVADLVRDACTHQT